MEPSRLSLAELEQFDPRAKAGSRERRFCCPFCGQTKPMDTAHRCLCVNIESGTWNCKRCGVSGKLTEYWVDRSEPAATGKHLRLAQAQRMLDGSPARVLEPNPHSVEGYRRQIRGVKPIANSPAEHYLAARKIPLTLAEATSCKYSPYWGKIGPAVIFPIRDESGKAISAAGRAIEGTGKQTFGPRSLGVFATPGALDADPVAITEAPIDACSLALAGLPAIALCGTAGLPMWVVTRLARPSAIGKSRTVYLAFDADGAGDNAAVKIDGQLSLVKTARLRPECSKDWNAMLIDQGLCSLLRLPDIARMPAKTIQPPFLAESCVESQSGAGFSKCRTCGSIVALQPYNDSAGVCWYECEVCGDCATHPTS